MSVINSVTAREILDSRGNPTVEVEVRLEDKVLVVPRFQVVLQLARLKPLNFEMVDQGI